ncbi:MAG TPA: CBS domain-containing protein [Candidatus Binataceae bacterium]|nr:CBS domain-containing protein [Candidatus Binataceae bacterium]
MLISRLMTYGAGTVSSSDTLRKAADMMKRGGYRRVPVVDNDRLVGIVSERDIRAHNGYLDITKVSAVMTCEPKTVTPHMSVEDAARLMIEHKIGGLPVLEDGKLVGIITTTDVLKAFLKVEAATQTFADD